MVTYNGLCWIVQISFTSTITAIQKQVRAITMPPPLFDCLEWLILFISPVRDLFVVVLVGWLEVGRFRCKALWLKTNPKPINGHILRQSSWICSDALLWSAENRFTPPPSVSLSLGGTSGFNCLSPQAWRLFTCRPLWGFTVLHAPERAASVPGQGRTKPDQFV